jgi:hypothetical protein
MEIPCFGTRVPSVAVLLVLASGIARGGETATASPTSTPLSSTVVSLDGDGWLLATDPTNVGRDEKWFEMPQAEAKPTKVPWIIQDAFPGYHGVAWYWREFDASPNSHADGRYLLRFWAVDYRAEVWLNGTRVGEHEGGETPFVLDVTDAIRVGADAKNLLAVRVLNPTHERIDGIVLNETPKQARVIPYHAGAAYNHGGITGSVELLATPAVRVEDLFAHAEPKTGVIKIQANVRNAGKAAVRGRLEFTVAPAAGGETLRAVAVERELAPGDSLVEAEAKIDQPRLWELNAPFLYRVTAQMGDDQRSVRCGFREFRFENGYFQLNGRRIFLRSTHTCNHFPVGLKLPPDPDMARRDLLDLKVMGFNMIRFIWGGAERYQLDLCDEIGLMVYQESFASWPMQDSPELAERWERSLSELIRRDRNHPSVVIWGLLNEVRDAPHFRLAAASLPLVRQLDPTRMVFLNSGRWDLSGVNDAVFSRLDIWHSQAGREPWATLNPSDQPVQTPFNFTWPPQQVALHPGPHGQYSVVRWTSPATDRYRIAVTFTGLFHATTDVHLFHNDRPQFTSRLNIGGSPNTIAHKSELALAAEDTIDFVVGWGNGNYGSDSTALTATITAAAGQNFDLAAEFPSEKKPCRAVVVRLARTGRRTRSGHVRPVHGVKIQTATALRESCQSRLCRVGGHPRRPASVPARAAHGRDCPVAADRSTASRLPLFMSEYGIGSAVDLWRVTRHLRATRRDARRRRAVLS